MEKVDYTDIKKIMMESSSFDGKYNFYYDETNNIRSLSVREHGFNSEITKDFVLGGIVTKPDFSIEKLESLILTLNFQPNMSEIKLKNMMASGNFFECMKSDRVSKLLKWLCDSDVFIHFHALNLLHYSLADIVDSFLDERAIYYSSQVKTIITELAFSDLDNIIDLLYKYQFPNLNKENIDNFRTDFVFWLKNLLIESNDQEFYIQLLIQSMKIKSNNDKLIFLFDNTPNKLIDSFFELYVSKVFLFSNSFHLFDEEPQIENQFENTEIIVDGIRLINYDFSDSRDSIFLQISDVIAGLIGKLFTISNEITEEDIVRLNLTDNQVYNISLLKKVIDKSAEENVIFIGYTNNHVQIQKIQKILSFKKF